MSDVPVWVLCLGSGENLNLSICLRSSSERSLLHFQPAGDGEAFCNGSLPKLPVKDNERQKVLMLRVWVFFTIEMAFLVINGENKGILFHSYPCGLITGVNQESLSIPSSSSYWGHCYLKAVFFSCIL